MTGLDWGLLALLGLGAAGALRYIRRHGACGGHCSGCPHSGRCQRKPPDETPRA